MVETTPLKIKHSVLVEKLLDPVVQSIIIALKVMSV